MAGSDNESGQWLRPATTDGTASARGAFERGGWLVLPDRRLSQLVHRRPPGVTTHQWNSALRTRLDFVVCDPGTGLPCFAVEFVGQRTDDADRAERMTRAVCRAVGLKMLRIESTTLTADSYGRQMVEYVIDAHNFTALGPDPATGERLSYRDIVGRLPDGRRGFVNDLGAVARIRAVDAYVEGDLADPLVRGLHVSWKDGPAEGWAWVAVRDGQFLFERTRIWLYDFSFGVAPDQLAEDLAVAGIGQRLKTLGVTEPVLHDRDRLRHELEQLKARRDDLAGGFAYDHVSFG